MTEELIEIITVEADTPALISLRRQVFIEEQKVPEELEWDEYDSTAWHFLLQINNRPVACARLKTDGQIGRMAVLPEYRHKGYGARLLRHVMDYAGKQSLQQVYLHAQTSAVGFYEKHGFVAEGDIFIDANIPHRTMRKNT